MEDNYDVIVIGGGLGGLTAGAKLAKEGKKVLLIEQHYIVGGCATAFKRKGFTFEVGLHELDGLHEDDIKVEIFNELGVFDNIEFIKLPEFYKFYNERVDMVVPHGTEEAIKALIDRFPKEEDGIRKFFKKITEVYKEISKLPREKWKQILYTPIMPFTSPNLVFNSNQTIGEYLDSIISDEDLKLLLLGNLGYYSDNPYRTSLFFYSFGQASYFNGGGYFIKGGSQKLSDYLASLITNNGGKVILSHLVTKILVTDGKASGVECRKTHKPNDPIKTYSSKVIIANAAVPNLIPMLPDKESKLFNKKVNNLEDACSLLALYIGFKSDLKKLGSKHYSTFLFHKDLTKISELYDFFGEDIEKRIFVFVDYGQIDSQLAPDGKTVGTICAIDYLKDWQNLSDEEYKKRKEHFVETLFNRLEEFLPGIKNEIEYYEFGTPKTIQRFTLNRSGTPYGFASTTKQSGMLRLPHRSPVENLYLASVWTYPGHGFSGAITSGWLCAQDVLNDIFPNSWLSVYKGNQKYKIDKLVQLKSDSLVNN